MGKKEQLVIYKAMVNWLKDYKTKAKIKQGNMQELARWQNFSFMFRNWSNTVSTQSQSKQSGPCNWCQYEYPHKP